MSILLNLKKVHAAVVTDNTKAAMGIAEAGKLGEAIGRKAVMALTGGIKSDAWKEYMALFANNATELERLTTPQQDEEDYLPRFRAYIVSNAICGASTDTGTNDRVGETIDSGFSPQDMAADQDFIDARTIEIPEL